MTAIFLCYGNPEAGECIGCGGWVHAEPQPGEEPGPFEAPEGSLALGQYCSESCWESWDRHLRRERAQRANQIRCCHLCGFDNQEHADWCLLNGVDDHRRLVAHYGARGEHWRWTGPWQITVGGATRSLEYELGTFSFPYTVIVAT